MNAFTEVERSAAMFEAQNVVLRASGAFGIFLIMPIGSVEINGRGKDIDIIVLVALDPSVETVSEIVPPAGWQTGGSANADDRWESWKRDIGHDGLPINILVTADKAIFETWKVSTRVCQYLVRRLGPIDKKMRVAVHRIIQENFMPENADGDVEND